MNTPTPMPVSSQEEQAPVFYTPSNTVPPQLGNDAPAPIPTNAAVSTGSTHQGAPVQGMSSRGENLPAYQNMSQILFHENLRNCEQDYNEWLTYTQSRARSYSKAGWAGRLPPAQLAS